LGDLDLDGRIILKIRANVKPTNASFNVMILDILLHVSAL
jgi:hypothetical protein